MTIHDEEGGLDRDFVATVRDAVDAENGTALRDLVEDLHEADLGDLLQALTPEQRDGFVRLLGRDFDWLALTEVDESVREKILASIPNETIAQVVRELEPDDAVEIIANLDEEDREEVLAGIPIAERIAFERSLDYPENSAGRRMTTKFIAVPPFWTVGQATDFLRGNSRLPEEFTEIYVVDPRFCFLGTVPLNRLLRAGAEERIEDIKGEVDYAIHATDDQEDAARLFERYNLLSAGIVDENNRLVGVITVDDMVDVIEAAAEQEMRRLAGVGDEELSDSVVYSVRSRFWWLLVNLFTAILASSVIGLFDNVIQQMVALAVLMPIVASMGGNAGTQTMTLAVRALSTRDIKAIRPGRFVRREVTVGLINGVLFAILMGAIAGLWFGRLEVGLLIASAMIVNMIAAALAGILIPLALFSVGADPAIASTVFVTTVTDCVGFFAFLGLATLWIH
ncbi:magnesium transporter [Faunimonas pinastri]|nr:magnesium transporter [Faunimonas pinastri]